MLKHVEFAEGLDIGSILPFTQMMLDYEWPTVQLIAAHLVDRKQLSYDEVVELLQAA
jgi:hypothetical protein